jgi:ribosome-interacting GTPase 1
MAKTQKNKATSFHLGTLRTPPPSATILITGTGQLKAKLAKLKRELLNPTTSGGSGAGGMLQLLA